VPRGMAILAILQMYKLQAALCERRKTAVADRRYNDSRNPSCRGRYWLE